MQKNLTRNEVFDLEPTGVLTWFGIGLVKTVLSFLNEIPTISNLNQYRSMYNKNNLAKIKKMDALAPDVMKAFWALDKAAVAEGAIPVKYKELIAVAVAVTTQCPYCIDIHAGNARKAGATEAEMVEAAMVAASLRAGGAVTHATHILSD